MKCRLCGAKVKRKNGHCTRCGAKIMRNPNEIRKLMFKAFLALIGLILLFVAFIISLFIFDKTHQDDALLPGLYTGMTKLDMLIKLQADYPYFYNGKQTKAENPPEGTEPMVYTAYTEYGKALGLNRAMQLEAYFFESGGEIYLHSYTLSMPYITALSNDGTVDKVTVHDIQTKVVPVLTELYGESENAEGTTEYLTHFNFGESVRAEYSKVSKLVGYQDALLSQFKSYESMSTCLRITYAGKSSKLFWHTLF